jgi:hypothetical protein
MKSPLEHALGQAIKHDEIIVVAYGNVFESLWSEGLCGASTFSIAGRVANWGDGRTVLVVVGTVPPTLTLSQGLEAVNCSEYLSAFSWAAAWRLMHPNSPARIVIVGNGATGTLGPTATSIMTLIGASSPSKQALCPGLAWCPEPKLTEIVIRLTSTASIERMGNGSKVAYSLLRNALWSGLIANPESHHSISNVLGAAMLSGLGGENHIAFKALAGLLGSLGIALNSGQGLKPMDLQPVSKASETPFLLFDDMGSIWKPALTRLLESVPVQEAPVSITAPATGTVRSGGIKHLIERLEALAALPYERRFLTMGDFGVEGEFAVQTKFILFLDLRLFGTSDSATEDEKEMISRLEPAHARLVESAKESNPPTALPWLPVAEEQRGELIDGLTNPVAFVPGMRKARSLLPRLISLIDPTLPIIIFSSTQEGAVLRAFAAHGNIVTRFSKPVFRGPLGDLDEWRSALQLSFSEAMKEAAGILETRRIFLHLQSAASVRPPNALAQSTQGPKPKAVSVEIYWDESGQAHEKPFGIGGMVIVSRSAEFDHQAFTSELRNINKLWGASEEAPFLRKHGKTILGDHSLFPQDYALKGAGLKLGVQTDASGNQTNHNALLDLDMSLIQRHITACGGELYAFTLFTEENSSTSLFSERHPHHRYRDMLRSVLEILLFHFQPVVKALEEGAWLAVDAPTWSPTWQTPWGDRSAAQKTLGLEIESDRARYSAFGRADLFPLLLDVIHQSGILPEWRSRIRRARAVQLVDIGRKDEALREGSPQAQQSQLSSLNYALTEMPKCPPQQVHYLADWIVHVATQPNDRGEIPNLGNLNRWFSAGWLQKDSAELRQSLRAIRRWKQGREVEALKIAMRCLPPSSASDVYSLARSLPCEMACWYQKVTGAKLRLLFESAPHS